MQELLGKKIGMTQVFDATGIVIPVTVIEAGPCFVVRTKSVESDGYVSVEIGFESIIEKKSNKPMLGIFKKANIPPKKYLHEFRVDKTDGYSVSQEIKADIFKVGEHVDISGVSIGKGFAGSVKRHHFNRGPMSHGSKSHRLPGSSGAGTSPGNIKKGMRRAGQLGNKKITVKNLAVVTVDAEKNIMLVRGAVPGSEGSLLVIRKRVK